LARPGLAFNGSLASHYNGQTVMLTTTHARVVGLLAVIAAPVMLLGQDSGPSASWHQLGGPARNFHVESAPLADVWPASGPTQLWSRTLGEGYSSVVADGETLVTMYRDGDDEIIIGLDADTGATRWRHAYDAPLAHNGYVDIWLNASGPGPYSTPLISDGGVFAVGVDGAFHALELDTGALRWAHDLVDLFSLNEYNAFASSPLAFGATIILPLGGSGHGVAAFDRETGAVVWQSEPFAVAPWSPQIVHVDGQDQLVVVGQQELVGLGPEDGRLLWRHPHENELGLNLSMPVWGEDRRLFMSSAYDGGSRMIRLSQIDGRATASEMWSTNRMRMHFTNALRVGDLVIGSSGDFGPAFLTALNVTSGEEVWRSRSFARAHMLFADGKLVIVDEDGDLAVASVTDAGLTVHARTQILTANALTPPTLVGSTLYVRDRKTILALDLGR
jgi:outer membrane protein assembly factor BamB